MIDNIYVSLLKARHLAVGCIGSVGDICTCSGEEYKFSNYLQVQVGINRNKIHVGDQGQA
jgi:hypothetical protein